MKSWRKTVSVSERVSSADVVRLADAAEAYLAEFGITEPRDVHGIAARWTVGEWAQHAGRDATLDVIPRAIRVLQQRDWAHQLRQATGAGS